MKEAPEVLTIREVEPDVEYAILISTCSGAWRYLIGDVVKFVDLRNSELPNLGAELGEYVARAVDELNRAHNASSDVPPPAQLTGRNTGLDLPTDDPNRERAL